MAKQAPPWDPQTDVFINEIDGIVSEKYGISFRDLLLNPGKYSGKKDIKATFQNIKTEVDNYFKTLLSTYADELEKVNNELESLTSQYKELDALIASKASLAKVPYIKPSSITRKEQEEEITIKQYDPSLEPLVSKLVSISHYVADMSIKYKNNVIGSWLFSGSKNYVLTLEIPASDALVIQTSKDTIDMLLGTVEPFLQ
ncbi:MAG: hypothetical protein ACP5GD_01895 [Candidatus Micrarchaeia archaeon]|jgi:hypothetical protein